MIFIHAFLMVLAVVGIFLAIIVPSALLVSLTMVIYTDSPPIAMLPTWARWTLRIVYPLVMVYLTCLVMVMNGASVL